MIEMDIVHLIPMGIVFVVIVPLANAIV